MDMYTWIPIPYSVHSRGLDSEDHKMDDLPLPVLRYPPLAILLNGILEAFNYIRSLYALVRLLVRHAFLICGSGALAEFARPVTSVLLRHFH